MILERLRWLTWVFVLLFAVVDARLAHLQFVARDFWESEARATREDGEFVPFRRGAILDRFGKPLAVGEIDQTLNLLYYKFRRDTPLGQVSAGIRMLVEDFGRSDIEQPALHEILQQPERWSRLLLSPTPAQLTKVARSARLDYWFYVRSVLGMTEKEFRAVRDSAPDEQPFSAMVPDAVERSINRIKIQAEALRELAAAIGQDRGSLMTTIESRVSEIESDILREKQKPDSDAKKVKATRIDLENRIQLLARGIPYKAVFLVNMTPERFDGIEIRDIDSRRYPAKYENIAPMLIGWVGEATAKLCDRTHEDELRLRQLDSMRPEEIDDEAAAEMERLRRTIRFDDYRPEEQLGREGMEGVLEAALRGHRGWKRVKHDKAQKDVELLDESAPIDGQDVRLTLDAELQLATQRAMDHFHHQGAIVLLDANDGAIRAMATWPNPTRAQLKDDYAELMNDPLDPLYHRAYRTPGNPPPPGSVFKLVVAAAGLEGGTLGEFTSHDCQKVCEIANQNLHCLAAHGNIELKTALEKSCNIYFYKSALAIGFPNIVDMARRFGVGPPSGFGDPKLLGLGGESKSIGEMGCPLRPSDKTLRYTLLTAIGHGAVDDITPLQVATFVAPLANYGNRVTPYLVDRIGDAVAPHTPPAKIGLKNSTLDTIRRAMEMVCEPGGTAGPKKENGRMYDLQPWRVAGKTGTPEAIPQGHAWFAGYFPKERPTLVFAIFAEAVETHGGDTCRPILQDLLEQPELETYVTRTKSP